MNTEWVPGEENIETLDFNGNTMLLKKIPVQVNKKRKISMVDIDDVIKAEQEVIAERNCLEAKQLPILCFLLADVKHPIEIKGLKVSKGMIKQTTRLHKMLFDLWQKSLAMNFMQTSTGQFQKT